MRYKNMDDYNKEKIVRNLKICDIIKKKVCK